MHVFKERLGKKSRAFLLAVQHSVMGNRLFGVSDLADTLSNLYLGMDPFNCSRIPDTRGQLTAYNFCKYSTISGPAQFCGPMNLRRILPERSIR